MFCILKDTNLKYFPDVGIGNVGMSNGGKNDWRGVYSSIKVPVSKKNQWTVTLRLSDNDGATTNQPIGIEFLTEKTSIPNRLTNHIYFAKSNQTVSKAFLVDGSNPFIRISALGSDAVAFSQIYLSIGSYVLNIFEENAKQLIKPYLLCYRRGKIYRDFMSVSKSFLSDSVRLESEQNSIRRCIQNIPQSSELLPNIHDVHKIPMWLSTYFDDIYGIGFGYKETVQDRGLNLD